MTAKYLFMLMLLPFASCGSEFDREEIVNTLIEHYKSECDGYDDCELSVTEENGVTEITQGIKDDAGMIGSYSVPKETDFIKGDLDGDNINEVIVSVFASTMGTAYWVEIFIFRSDQSYLLFKSTDLAMCPEKGSHDGRFTPEKISNGLVIGLSECYAEHDPHVDPSLKYRTEFKLDGDQLTVVRQEKLN